MVIDGIGAEMFALIAKIYPICRSVTGDGVRQTLREVAAMPEVDRVLGNAEKLDPAAWAASARVQVQDIMAVRQTAPHLAASFSAHVRAFVDGEAARSERITPELHRARSGWWTRLFQFGAYFVMAVLDYNVTRRLNFGSLQPRRRRIPPG